MNWRHTDLLGLRFFTKQELLSVVDQAIAMKAVLDRPIKQVPTLRGRTVVNLFFEPSTRTRISFELAIKAMGASSITISKDSSSVKKGETLFDTVRNLQAMGVSAIILRHANSGAPHFVAEYLDIPVINAGDGYNEHPTQGLLDLMTLIERWGTVEGKKILILGDIAHSRVARSNIWALTKCGATVYVSGPKSLIPGGIEKLGAIPVAHPGLVLGEVDAVNVLRVQYERQTAGFFPSIQEYRLLFGLTYDKLKMAKPDLVILHPGPMNRGIEIDSDVADGPQNVILDQVKNGIAVRMAVLYLLLAKAGEQ